MGCRWPTAEMGASRTSHRGEEVSAFPNSASKVALRLAATISPSIGLRPSRQTEVTLAKPEDVPLLDPIQRKIGSAQEIASRELDRLRSVEDRCHYIGGQEC